MSIKLSKSKVNTFINCPRQFKYQNIDKLQSEENPAFELGTNVHSIAENFIKSWPIDENDILKFLLKDESSFKDDYVLHCENLAIFFKEMLIDKKYSVFMAEEYLFSEKYNFSGLADLVLENNDGKLIVIDYKTGKSSTVKNYKLELCYYKMLIEDLYPDKEVLYAGIFFTKDGKLSFMKFSDELDESNCSLKDYNLAIGFLHTVRLEIEKGDFPPKRQFLCKYCGYKKYCEKEQ